ncbi:glycosyltransferase family 1 protein [Dyella sp.]|uniref:glycosyltransferase family 4 protein n=1 Tax=Dyella sp. TaxID=1869338 RepID=UPI002D7A030E|nr:glycosyltransferase family 1 protein [Dyella sp.]HET7331972.1 glycosyltransferase family 1 protein [Dyella sp.]
MSPLSIGFDDRWVEGGIGRFSREVSSRLRLGGATVELLGIRTKIHNPLGPLMIARRIKRQPMDVFWSPGFLPPTTCNVPTVVTIHDLIHRRHGGFARRQYYDHCIRPLARRAQSILTVSHYSRNEIIDWLGCSECEVKVVSNGVSELFQPEGIALDMGRPYFLYAGNHRRHKNTERLIRAFASSSALNECILAFTGIPDATPMEWAARDRIGERVRFLGKLDEAALAAAYRGALAVVQISLEEGFGLPVIEAMACGTPVLCSATTALGEVAGEAAILVDPIDTDAIRFGMENLVENGSRRSKMRALGLRRAAMFSWDSVASRTFEALQQAANT